MNLVKFLHNSVAEIRGTPVNDLTMDKRQSVPGKSNSLVHSLVFQVKSNEF